MPDLLVAPCEVKAARWAVEHWHYSRSMPVGKAASFGVWEGSRHDGGRFIGAVVFSWGANRNMAKTYRLQQTEAVELVRVALTVHQAPVSQVVAQAIKQLHKASPRLRLVVSYADTMQGHHGGIYQAGNWLYTGLSQSTRQLVMADGSTAHKRAYTGPSFGTPTQAIPAGAHWRDTPGKHRYLMPLDRAMRRAIQPMALPYPEAVQRESEPAA